AQRDRAFRRNVGESENAKADEHSESQQREDEADGHRSDQQTHRASSIGLTQQAPRTNSLWAAGDSRSSARRWSTPCSVSVSKTDLIVVFKSILPFLSGRYENAAAWKCPAG